MLTLKMILENREDVVRRLEKKHFAAAAEMIDNVIAADARRRAAQQESDAMQAQMNQYAKSIGGLMKEGKKAEAEAAKTEVAKLKEKSAELKSAMEAAETEVRDLLLQIPNVPNDSVPEGRVAEDNVVERMGGENPVFEGFEPLPHWELAKKYDLIDFEMGVKITGAGFPIYKGKGARLQRALINFFLDEAREAGYLEVEPPYVVNEV